MAFLPSSVCRAKFRVCMLFATLAGACSDPRPEARDAQAEAGVEDPVPESDASASMDGSSDDTDDADLSAGDDAGEPDAETEQTDAGSAADAGTDDARILTPLSDQVERGRSLVVQAPRPAYGALVVAQDGERSYVVESRRDAEPGPYGIPWRSRFRVAAYDGAVQRWVFEAEPDDVIGDVVVHASGDVTLSIEHFPPQRDAYELVRLSRAGELRSRVALAPPTTIPDGDYGPDDPRPLFRMKSAFADATAAGWVRLLPDGEGLTVAFLSFLDVPPSDPRVNRMALGLLALDFQSNKYVERWARVVEGAHRAEPAAWAYDELRWMEQAVRPFLARDALSGDIVVGRAWNQARCRANLATFAEFASDECMLGAVNVVENERLPLAVTRFDARGGRLTTRILRPDMDAAEQVPFALAARAGELAVVGAVVRTLPDGSKKSYPDPSGYVDYDGYVCVYDAEGAARRHHDFNLGRGDVLAALRWSERGILAVGSADWDRWQGGMSISRGSSPLIVWFSQDGSDTRQRVVLLGDASRHFNLHDVALLDDAVIGYGFSDAPLTHSADMGGSAARTFGPLQLRLEL